MVFDHNNWERIPKNKNGTVDLRKLNRYQKRSYMRAMKDLIRMGVLTKDDEDDQEYQPSLEEITTQERIALEGKLILCSTGFHGDPALRTLRDQIRGLIPIEPEEEEEEVGERNRAITLSATAEKPQGMGITLELLLSCVEEVIERRKEKEKAEAEAQS